MEAESFHVTDDNYSLLLEDDKNGQNIVGILVSSTHPVVRRRRLMTTYSPTSRPNRLSLLVRCYSVRDEGCGYDDDFAFAFPLNKWYPPQ